MAVLLGHRITTPADLAAFHRRFDAWEPRVLTLVVTAEVAMAVLAALTLSLWAVPAVAVFAIAGAGVRASPRLSTALTRSGAGRST